MDGVGGRLILLLPLLDRADGKLVQAVPHSLSSTPPKHSLGHQDEGEANDTPDPPEEPSRETVQGEGMIHRTRTQIPGQAEQLEHTEDGKTQGQAGHNPGVLESPQGSPQHLYLHLLVPDDGLRRPQLIQARVQRGAGPGSGRRERRG